MKKTNYSWSMRCIGMLFVLALHISAFAQIEPPDTLQQKSPEIDTSINNVQFGIDKPGTIVDTVRIQTQAVGHSPIKAALFSAVLPGLGQAYNGKYWKIPLIYAGGLGVGFAITYQNDKLSVMQRARLAVDRGADNENPLNGTLAENANIDRGIEVYNRERDFMIILMAALYALNIADAIVDAHLKEFEVNEDLSFRLNPSIEQTAPALNTQFNVGLALTLTFK